MSAVVTEADLEARLIAFVDRWAARYGIEMDAEHRTAIEDALELYAADKATSLRAQLAEAKLLLSEVRRYATPADWLERRDAWDKSVEN